MNVVFGLSAMAIGMTSVIKFHSLPTIILALIVGALIGEIINLDSKVKHIFHSAIEKLNFKIEGNKDDYMAFYLIVAVTFCTSGTNIFGAINESITGDYSILLSKAIMDIFAAILGTAMNLIVIPQFIILSICFYIAKLLMPFITDTMLNDFIAIGGLLTFVLGLSIAQIKQISAVNLLPSLLLIWPSSYLFSLLMG